MDETKPPLGPPRNPGELDSAERTGSELDAPSPRSKARRAGTRPRPPITDPPIARAAPVSTHRGRSIRDFLTDGSLAALCDELTQLTGLRIELRDEQHRRVRFDLSQPGASWRIEDARAAPLPDGTKWMPITAGGDPIGWLVTHPPAPSDAHPPASVDRAIYYLASAASELCEQELSLLHRVKEVELMYRLSSLLARACGAERVLEEALDSAIRVMELDAGSVVLLPEGAEGVTTTDERELELKAAYQLSDDWLESALPLSRDRAFDRLALDGEIVAIENLLEDDRVIIPDRVREEGLRAFISAGLVFEGRPIGVFRLYAREPRRFTDADRRLLTSVAEQSALAVEQARLLRLRAQEEQTQRQLSLAADVQQRMLPRLWPDVPGFDIAARSVASYRVGGDFYDAFKSRGRLAVAVGDVVGNGIAAALLMASVRTALRAFADEHADVHEIVARVNRSMCRDTLQSEFATLWHAQIDPETLEMRSVSAGHDPPTLLRPSERGEYHAERLPTGGLVIGLQEHETYDAISTPLRPGDVLVVHTDGLTEAMSFDAERFGVQRIRDAGLDALRANPEAPARDILEHIFWSLRQFTGLHAKPDDQTAMVIRVRPR